MIVVRYLDRIQYTPNMPLLAPVCPEPRRAFLGRSKSKDLSFRANPFVCHTSVKFTASEHPIRMRVLSERSESKDLEALLSPLSATDPRNCLLSPFIATLPKTPSRKSFVCHTSKTPPGGYLPPVVQTGAWLAKQTGGFLTLANPCSVPQDQIHQGLLPLVGRPPAHPEIPSPANPVIIRFPGLRDCC